MNESHEKISELLCRSREGEAKCKEIEDIYVLMKDTEECDDKQINTERQMEQHMEDRMQ
jgi:hypothetical protein